RRGLLRHPARAEGPVPAGFIAIGIRAIRLGRPPPPLARGGAACDDGERGAGGGALTQMEMAPAPARGVGQTCGTTSCPLSPVPRGSSNFRFQIHSPVRPFCLGAGGDNWHRTAHPHRPDPPEESPPPAGPIRA